MAIRKLVSDRVTTKKLLKEARQACLQGKDLVDAPIKVDLAFSAYTVENAERLEIEETRGGHFKLTYIDGDENICKICYRPIQIRTINIEIIPDSDEIYFLRYNGEIIAVGTKEEMHDLAVALCYFYY
jgi:hypothetical protein